MEQTVWWEFQAAVYTIISGLGIFGHVVLLIPLFRYYKTNFSKPFYTICISLAICDIGNLSQDIINRITDPLLFTDANVNLVRWKGFFARFFWYGTTFHQFLIAMERSFIVLCPPGSKLIMTRTKVFTGLLLVWVVTVLCNFCILTSYCPYIKYPNTTTLFYDYSVFGATLHNQLVDFGIQGVTIGTTVTLYIMAGIKVRLIKKKVQSTSNVLQKKNRLDKLLLLQGVFVSIPHTIVIIVYHSIFFIPNLPITASAFMSFSCKVIALLGFGLNPMLHLKMNKDLRAKTAETFCTVKVFSDSEAILGAALTYRSGNC